MREGWKIWSGAREERKDYDVGKEMRRRGNDWMVWEWSKSSEQRYTDKNEEK